MKEITAKGNSRRVFELQVLRDWPATKLDADVLDNKDIKSTAYRFYTVIATLVRDECYVELQLETLAKILGYSTRTIRRHIKNLIDNGVVEIEPAKTSNGSSWYRFTVHECIRDNIKEARS